MRDYRLTDVTRHHQKASMHYDIDWSYKRRACLAFAYLTHRHQKATTHDTYRSNKRRSCLTIAYRNKGMELRMTLLSLPIPDHRLRAVSAFRKPKKIPPV